MITAKEHWVFGLADRGFNLSLVTLFLVSNRTSNTLLPLIESNCITRTIVHSDKLKGYNRGNSSMRFIHRTVNHSESFINPQRMEPTLRLLNPYGVSLRNKLRTQRG